MKQLNRILAYSAGTMLLTIVHHLYGAFIYKAAFRLHVVLYAIPVILVLAAGFFTYSKTKDQQGRLSKIALGTFLITTLLFPVIAIGLYEGGYNHVLKNILYFTGVPVSFMNRVYPAVYELPNNFTFEFTGILQFITGFLCLVHIRKLPYRVFKII